MSDDFKLDSSPEAKPSKKDGKAYYKWYYETHKKQCQAATAKWWNNHRDKLREKWRNRVKNNPEKFRQKRKEYRLRNLSEKRAANRKWQKDNWDYRQKYMRDYYAKNAAKIKSKCKDWTQRNKAKTWHYSQKRRALVEQASANVEVLHNYVDRIKSKKWCYCYYCECRVSSAKIHFDHIIPLSKGGQHSIENICVSCPSCNLSKHDSKVSSWKKLPQTFLEL